MKLKKKTAGRKRKKKAAARRKIQALTPLDDLELAVCAVARAYPAYTVEDVMDLPYSRINTMLEYLTFERKLEAGGEEIETIPCGSMADVRKAIERIKKQKGL